MNAVTIKRNTAQTTEVVRGIWKLSFFVEDIDFSSLDLQFSVDKKLDGLGINAVFNFVDLLGDRLRRVIFLNPDCLLQDDGAVIHFVVDKMDRCAGNLGTVRERILDALDSFKR